MAQVITVDSPAGLRAAATEMDDVYEAVSHTVTTLYETLTRLGDPISAVPSGTSGSASATVVSSTESPRPPWATDATGRKFASGASGYVAMSVDLLQGGFDLAQTLTEFAKGMRQAADGLQGADEYSARG
ncbi:hypothetical protein ABZ942_40830 [Nocardia sp. NPDC046473]|uniref:hypothetical protein n=1 Tax=Nocardia sp. NPDC046473 TaxID=3155733 RepID=UPI0033C9E55C